VDGVQPIRDEYKFQLEEQQYRSIQWLHSRNDILGILESACAYNLRGMVTKVKRHLATSLTSYGNRFQTHPANIFERLTLQMGPAKMTR
jgi:hypothetical protein